MPRRPLRPCAHAGCPVLVVAGRCPEHARQLDRSRGTAAERDYGAEHRKWRDAVLARDPICKICRKALSTVADHIVPKSDGGKAFDTRNGQGLCAHCHNSVKQSADKRSRKERGGRG